MRYVVVSRHPGLKAWAERQGLVPPSTIQLERVSSSSQIVDATVIGDIPLALAALAHNVISVVIDAPEGKKLSAEEIDDHVRGYTRVAVFQLDNNNPYRMSQKGVN